MISREVKELAPYSEKARRIELVIRWIYGIAIGIIFWLWGIFISILNFIHFWHILILGKRHSSIYRHTRRYINAVAYVDSYLMFLTDARPDLTPNHVFFYREAGDSESPTDISEAKYCISCGGRIPEEAEFCHKCGKKQ